MSLRLLHYVIESAAGARMHSRPPHRRSIALGCLVPFLVGCGEGDGEPPRSVVRDSAGIRIVENTGPVWSARDAWRLAPEPAVAIGQVEGESEYLLTGPLSTLRLSDGTIVVADAGTEEIRWYDPTGRFLKRAGGRGGGPGEFRNLTWVYPLGDDSIVAWDDSPPRMVWYHRDGTFARLARPGNAGGVLRGVFRDGSLLLAEHLDWAQRPNEGRIRRPGRAYRLAPNGAIADSLGSFPGPEFDFRFHGRSVSLRSPPFERRTVFAVAADGFVAGSQDASAIGHYDRHGRLVALVRWPAPDRTVTEADIEAYRGYHLAHAEDADARRETEQWLERQTYPDQVPAHGAIVVDADGNVWVEQFHREWEDHRSWMVFDGERHLLGTVRIPGGFVVHQIGRDFVLGHARDPLDVEVVRLYRLVKPVPAGLLLLLSAIPLIVRIRPAVSLPWCPPAASWSALGGVPWNAVHRRSKKDERAPRRARFTGRSSVARVRK